MTGQLPPGNRGTAGLLQNRSIMNRAAQLHPEGNLAANSAEFAANAASLKNLQKNFDQVSAFEATARKNIDLAQQLAKNIPDLGVRFANVPVRQVTASLIGSENMARFRTALNTAQTEAAKVLNNSQGTGILSDSSRHELQEIVDGNLPLPAMIGVFDTLRQDMTNRHAAYSEQIADIRQRMGGGGAGATGAATGYTRIKASDGSFHDIPTANVDAARRIDPNLQVVQ